VEAAVAAAAPGATISVCAGTYLETLAITRDLTIVGAGDGSRPEDTILQASSPGPVVLINPHQQHVTLRGLSITGAPGATIGGGIHHDGDTLTITDCAISGNRAGNGGGIANGPSSKAFLTSCQITGNSSFNGGGGIYNGGAITLTNCLLEGNTSSGVGGGVHNTGQQSTLTLVGTKILNSRARSGGGIYNERGEVRLKAGSEVTGNVAIQQGGGIDNFGMVLLDASSVTGNAAGSTGGGIFNETNASTVLQNGSTISGNTAGGLPDNCAGAGFSGDSCG
jgi:hypothetical protein